MSVTFRPWDYIDRRALLILIGSILLTQALVMVSELLPSAVKPYMAMTFILGILFGPWGALGATLVSLHRDMTAVSFAEPATIALDFVLTFIMGYIPYKLWYSNTRSGRSKPPVFDSSRNIIDFVLVMVASGVIYTALYNILYGFVDGFVHFDAQDMGMFLNLIGFSLLFGMLAIVLCRYVGLRFWTPVRRVGTDFRDRIDPRIYDVALVLSVAIPAIICQLTSADYLIVAMIAGYGLCLFYCLRPVRSVEYTDKLTDIGNGIMLNRFDAKLTDRIIIIGVICGLFIGFVTIVAFYMGILVEIPGIENYIHVGKSSEGMTVDELARDASLTIYLGSTMIVFFAGAVIYLGYVEKTITRPLGEIADAAKDFAALGVVASSAGMTNTCAPYVKKNSEIGELARSLDKMATDTVSYVRDINSLNRERQAYRTELSIARQIQMSFVPRNFDAVDDMGVRIAGVMDAAKFVGGDLYDFTAVDDTRVALVIGDVSGKGVPAALFMSIAKALMEDHIRLGSSTGEVFTIVNNSLVKENTEMLFVTSWIGYLDTETGEVEYSNAGHCPPLIWRASEGKAEYLKMVAMPILGIVPETEYIVERTRLEPGDRILIYTDGVTEANSDYTGFYGSDRLKEMFENTAHASVEEQIRAIREDIRLFTEGADQFDDITMLLTEYQGRPVRSTGLGPQHELIGSEPLDPEVAGSP